MPMIKVARYSLPKEEAIWIAGFVDGEGSISILRRPDTKGKNFSLRVTVANTNEEIIRWFKSKFGGCVVRDEKNRVTDKNAKMGFIWHLSTGKALGFIKLIKPHLRLKSRQAELALKFYEPILQQGKRFYGNKDEHSRREEIYNQMRLLNQRGNKKHA